MRWRETDRQRTFPPPNVTYTLHLQVQTTNTPRPTSSSLVVFGSRQIPPSETEATLKQSSVVHTGPVLLIRPRRIFYKIINTSQYQYDLICYIQCMIFMLYMIIDMLLLYCAPLIERLVWVRGLISCSSYSQNQKYVIIPRGNWVSAV